MQAGTGERGFDRGAGGRFARGASGNPAGRPPRSRLAAYLAGQSRRRADMLLEWVLANAVHCSAAQVAAGAGELLAGAEALELAASTLRGLAQCRVAVDSHGTTDDAALPAGGRA